MTDDQIIAVAKVVRNGGHWDQLDIINFGRLIAAAEREACAEMVEDMDVQHPKYIAAAIRARGQA